MRTNREFTLRENASALRKLLSNRISLFYFKLFKPNKIWLIRDGGIGDAIISTAAIAVFRKTFPNTKLYLVTNTPSIFESLDLEIANNAKFPRIWLTYGHYDLPWMKNRAKHIKLIIGETLGLKLKESDPFKLNFSDPELLRQLQLKPKSYVIIQPAAGDWFKEKNWNAEYWTQLVQKLNKIKIAAHQIGTLEDEVIEGCVDWRGKLTLAQSLNLIQYSSGLIGVNSFGEQAAAAYNIPSIILYGPTNPVYSLNPGQVAISSNGIYNYKSISSLNYRFSSLIEISVDQVMNQVHDFLRLKKL